MLDVGSHHVGGNNIVRERIVLSQDISGIRLAGLGHIRSRQVRSQRMLDVARQVTLATYSTI